MIYFGQYDQLKIDGNANMQQAILRLCTGYNTAEEVIATLSADYDGAQATQLLVVLHEQSIVVDAKNCWQGYHAYGSNPMPFFSSPSDEQLRDLYRSQTYQQTMDSERSSFLQLLRRRASNREFSGKPISYDVIRRIACAGYGITGELEVMGVSIGRRTVPSAGALYPLSLHVVIRQFSDDGDYGIYTFDGVRLNTITKVFNDGDWKRCFLDDVSVQTHGACFIVSGDIERQTFKYADRGYRYTLLEAGHVAQNIVLACTEMTDIGCVEVGGFFDEEITSFLSLPAALIPITTVLVGPLS